MRHVDLALEAGLLDEVGDACAVVDVEVSEQKQVDLGWVHHVEVGQSLDALSRWVQSAVQHDLAALALEVDAGPSYLAASPKRDDFEILSVGIVHRGIDCLLADGNPVQLVWLQT